MRKLQKRVEKVGAKMTNFQENEIHECYQKSGIFRHYLSYKERHCPVFTLTRMEAAVTTNVILIIKSHETRSVNNLGQKQQTQTVH